MGPMTLRGEAVTLRPWSEDDIPAILAVIEDPDILHWIPVIPRPYRREDARAFVNDEIGLGPHSSRSSSTTASSARSACT